jgi:hypothetical protein
MSAELPPTEIVPIFNPVFFLGAADPFTKEVADTLYLQYPIGQGTEIIPDLVVSGELQAANNIIMTGTPAVNYIEFPDATKQYTSSAGAGINITDTNTNATYYPVFVDNTGSGITLRADKLTTPFSINPNTGDFNFAETMKLTQTQVAMGKLAGETAQNDYSVAIGINAGKTTQGESCVAIGDQAGLTTQDDYAVAIGYKAGRGSVAVGDFQGLNSIAIGKSAGEDTQASNAVAIGNLAGQTTQATNAVAIGNRAGFSGQGINTVAIGTNAGNDTQGDYSISVGSGAGQTIKTRMLLRLDILLEI